LAESGFVEGRNVVVVYRLANGQPDRVPGLAAELVHRPVNVLASGYQTARAAKDATATIPIVFMGGASIRLRVLALFSMRWIETGYPGASAGRQLRPNEPRSR
jgi:putative ABC transport system substrate-binding protein